MELNNVIDDFPYRWSDTDSIIAEHRSGFLDVFPQETLKPKHHFLEHYPQPIREFGPVAALWTMRFKAKHSFFFLDNHQAHWLFQEYFAVPCK